MRKTVINRFRDFVDFNVIQYGHEDCRSDYSIGNFIRENHLIHFIHKGSGTYSLMGKTYHLSEGDAFIIYPDDVTYYRASSTDPWEYSWVEFSGTGVSNFLSSTPFSKDSPVIYKNFSSEKPVLKLIDTDFLNPYSLYGALMEFLSSFVSSTPKPGSTADEYVKYALNYIHTLHFNNNMTINEISDYVGINRSYFCRIFKEKMGVSPKQYLTEFKMKTAKRLLEETNLTIGEISRSSGYEDPLYFSTTFKSFYGHSPSEHRKLM